MAKQAVKELRQLVTQPVDWPCVLHQTRQHNIGPLLWDRLRKLPENSVPGSVRESAKACYYETALHNAQLIRHAERAAYTSARQRLFPRCTGRTARSSRGAD